MATWDSTYNMWKGSTNSNQWGIWASIYELPGTTNIVNNTSVVRVDLWLGRTLSSGYPIGGTYNGYIEADRENYGGFPTQHIDIRNKDVNQNSVNIGPNVLVGTWDYTIQHNNDGSRNVRITTELSGHGFSPSYCVVDVVVGLSTIPRASTVNPLSAYIESQSNIVINPYASFNHSVRVWFGSINKWLQSDGTLGDNEYIFPSSNIRPSFVIPADFYSQFTSERGVGNIYVYTYSGGTKIGENHNTLTAICNPALCNPYATATVFDVNSKTLAITKNKNDVIRYQSIMEITPTITVSGVNDTQTTLKSKSINGTIFTTDTARVVNPTDKSFTLKLVNSRNMSSEIIVEASGELIPYIPLTFSANLWRTEPTTGEVEIEYSGNYFAKNFKEGSSTGTIAIGDMLTSDNLMFAFPDNFYETISTILEGSETHLLETDKYKIYVGNEGGTLPHYFVTVETLETADSSYNENNFVYKADYSDRGGWTTSINKTSLGTPTTLDLGTVTTISSNITIANMFQNKDKTSSSISNSLSLFWKYREKGTENWIDGTALEPTIDANNNTYSGSQSLGTIFDYRKQYEFIVLYNDKLMEQTSSVYPVSRGFPIFWWSEDAVHIMHKLYVADKEVIGGNWTLLSENIEAQVKTKLDNVTFTELYIEVSLGDDNGVNTDTNLITFLIPKDTLASSDKTFRNGFYFADFYNGSVVVAANTSTVHFLDAYLKGNPVNSNARMSIWYR